MMPSISEYSACAYTELRSISSFPSGAASLEARSTMPTVFPSLSLK